MTTTPGFPVPKRPAEARSARQSAWRGLPGYNVAFLDEVTKRMIRRTILKAVAIPGHQIPFASREMPLPTDGGRAASRSRRPFSGRTTCSR